MNEDKTQSKRPNFYFRSETDERCYTLEFHMSNARDEGHGKIELIEAVPEKINGWFWCKAFDECGEDGYCGKQCEKYEPKNGKSGMCKYRSNTFYNHGEKVTFTIL